ncbi:MAG TPA: D-Ala-D-Ala carboxypeptidase family metallohydrolase [Allosphingosinicella sp.]|jgi:hypothetical protein
MPRPDCPHALAPNRVRGWIGRLACAVAIAGLSIGRPGIAQEQAEGQDKADYHAWLAREPAARAQLLAFKQFLDMRGVDGVVPTWQLVRTASRWRECNGPRFQVSPFTEWTHIAQTLRFIRAHVEPVVGDVEAMSGYRNAELNACSGGARESAHRRFFALDLVPIKPIARPGMIRSLCAIHAWRGPAYEIGLGFYQGLRFHVDSKGYRKWGPDGKSATSPCSG